MTEGKLVATGLVSAPVHDFACWVQPGPSTGRVGFTR
jgi:hypothetical protein